MKRYWGAAMVCMAALMTNVAQAGDVVVKFYTPEIVRVEKTPDDKLAGRQSLVVTAEPQKVDVKTTRQGNEVTYESKRLKVKLDELTGDVSFMNKEGSVLLNEAGYLFTPIAGGIDKGAYKVRQSFALESDEPIYGFGMLQNGKLNQRGENRLMQQSNLEDYAHFFQSIKGYGIYWDNYSPTALSDDGVLSLESQVGDAVDYYFMYGGDADGVIADMRWLTGKVPMTPLWTYGFHQSRERYKTQDETFGVVKKYRETRIPLDGIIQDWQYWGSNYTWNAMEFINPDFNRAQQMIDSIHANNAHLTISIWSSFGPHTKQFAELEPKGLLFSFITWPESGLGDWPPRMDYPSGVRVYDCYSPEARDIYWKHLRRLHDMGIDAWWMDSTDPDHNQYKESDLDERCTMGSWRSVRNLYPFMTVGGVDQNLRREDRDKRVFILTRSYFAGQQRYGAHTWSGDVGSSWDNFRRQVPLCLNHTLTANPNVNTDIGGFFAGAYNNAYRGKPAYENPQYRELYTRWMQFGLFNPMMRSHGTDAYREIYYYGKEGEPIYDALVDAIKLRYRLMPYIYSTARRVSENDDSFMRALFMDFRQDKNTRDNNRQFMFGRNLLVCPVLEPLFTEEKIARTPSEAAANQIDNVDWTQRPAYEVYLPAGTDWYDFNTNAKHKGGQTMQTEAPIAYSPLFVKAGSIVPMVPDMQYTSERPWDDMTLRVYPGADADFTLYEDEGDGYNYLDGKYSEIPMKWDDRKRTLIISARRGEYPGMLQTRTFHVQLPDNTVKTITYKGKKTTVRF